MDDLHEAGARVEVASKRRPVTKDTPKYGEQWRLNSTEIESRIPKEGVEMALIEARGTPDFLLLNTRKNSSLCWGRDQRTFSLISVKGPYLEVCDQALNRQETECDDQDTYRSHSRLYYGCTIL